MLVSDFVMFHPSVSLMTHAISTKHTVCKKHSLYMDASVPMMHSCSRVGIPLDGMEICL